MASLDRAPHMRPPICLLYAMWTQAASMTDKYSCYQDILYHRARKYTEAAEMKVGAVHSHENQTLRSFRAMEKHL